MVVRADRASAVDLGTPRLAHADVVLAGLVAAALFAFFLAIQRGEYASYDGRIMAGVTRNLWEHGRLQSFGPLFPDGPLAEVYSQYGVGQSLLLLPFYGLQRLGSADGAQWMTLANPIVLACCGACLYVIGISIRLRRSTSIGMALAFGTLTMAPLYSTELFAEPAVTLGTLGVVLGLVRWRSQRATGPWLVGVGTAFSVLFRVDALLLVGAAALAIPVFVPWRRLCATWKQWLPAVALPVATVGLWQGYYNNLRYGAPLRDSYSGVSFDNPMLNGLGRQLLSPGKGFFWYNAILLAALPGLVWLWRRDRSLTMLLVGIAVLRVSFVARTPFPDGSVAWGPRYLLPWCALLALPLGEAWDHTSRWVRARRVAARTVFALLGALSVAAVIASVWVPYDQYWRNIGTEVALVPPDRYDTLLATRIDESFNSLSGSPLVVNLRTLGDGYTLPMRWFRGGATVFGVVAFTVAVAAATLAIRIARRADRASRELRERSDIDPARTRTEERSALLGS